MSSYNQAILFHGTSRARKRAIDQDGYLHPARSGPAKVAFTPDFEVARYWARLSAEVDCEEGRGDGSWTVLAVNAEDISGESFSDPVWGTGKCDWEREIAVWECVPVALTWEIEVGGPELDSDPDKVKGVDYGR